jgi:hypothetical protein
LAKATRPEKRGHQDPLASLERRHNCAGGVSPVFSEGNPMKVTEKFDYIVLPAVVVVVAIAIYGLIRLIWG